MITHLYDIITQRAAAFPEAVAIGGEEGSGWKTLTSAQLKDLVDRLAEELAAKGVRGGDRVILWLPHHWRAPVYLFALWKLGAIVVPFDRVPNPEAAALTIALVEPRLILVGYAERPEWLGQNAVVDWWEPGSMLDPAADIAPWDRPSEALATIYFTSGTTGQPKGCVISHANLCSQVQVLHHVLSLNTHSRLASILPLSHLFELTCGLLYPLFRGAAVHYIPHLTGHAILRVLDEQRATHMIVVPQLLSLLGRNLDNELRAKLPRPMYRFLNALALSLPFGARRYLFWPVHRKLGGRLAIMVSGGAALPPDTRRIWELVGVHVLEGYGTSECSPVVTASALDGSTPPGSVGKPIPGVEVELSAEGELLVRGPNVM